MEKQGLVTRTKDLEQKNLVRVTLTEKGREAYNKSTKRESIHRMLSSIPDDECKSLVACLKVLRDRALDEAGITSKPPFP